MYIFWQFLVHINPSPADNRMKRYEAFFSKEFLVHQYEKLMFTYQWLRLWVICSFILILQQQNAPKPWKLHLYFLCMWSLSNVANLIWRFPNSFTSWTKNPLEINVSYSFENLVWIFFISSLNSFQKFDEKLSYWINNELS